MKKKLAFMLAMVMAVATMLTGCGGKDVSGNYTANVNIADYIALSGESVEDAGIDISNLYLATNLELTADKKFEITFDVDSFKTDYLALMDEAVEGIIDSTLEEQGVSREDITDEVAEAMGYESADAFYADFKNEIMGSIEAGLEELDAEIAKNNVSGTYKVVKDTIIFVGPSDEKAVAFDTATIKEDGSIDLALTAGDAGDVIFNFKKN